MGGFVLFGTGGVGGRAKRGWAAGLGGGDRRVAAPHTTATPTPPSLTPQVEELAAEVAAALAVIDLPAAQVRLDALEASAAAEGLWEDRARAEGVLREVGWVGGGKQGG